jgi:hypothetical protein
MASNSKAFLRRGRLFYKTIIDNYEFEIASDEISPAVLDLARVRAQDQLNIPLKVVSPKPGSTINSGVTEFYLEDCNEGPSKLFEGLTKIENFMKLIEQQNLERSNERFDSDRKFKELQAENDRKFKELQAENDRKSKELQELAENDRKSKELQAENDRKSKELQAENDRKFNELQNENDRKSKELQELQNKNSLDELLFALQDLNAKDKLEIKFSTSGNSFSSLRKMRNRVAHYTPLDESGVALNYKWAVLLAVLENLTPKLRVMIELDYPWGKSLLDESLQHLRAKKLPKFSDMEGVPVNVKDKVARYFTFTLRAVGLSANF